MDAHVWALYIVETQHDRRKVNLKFVQSFAVDCPSAYSAYIIHSLFFLD